MELIIAYVLDEHGITLATWALTVVTALDAKVGVRIYTRVNVLITLIKGRVVKPTDQPEIITPEPRPTKTQNGGHFRN